MCNDNLRINTTTTFLLLLILINLNITSAQYSGWKFVEKLYNHCKDEKNTVKCLKIQVLKIANRSLKLAKINIYDGINLVQEARGRSLRVYPIPDHLNLQNMDEDHIDVMLNQAVDEFVSTRYLEFRQPKSLGEARKKKRINFWPLIAAMAIKSAFMGAAYKGIAVTAGAAMLIGKMALALCVIMGLKSLLSGKEEKLNVEVVKHPIHSTSHTYSNSYEDDHDHYHRSISAEEEMLRRAEEKWGPKE
nr:uncharacterized protein LOC111427109 [Onthophagus taurus]